MKNKIAFTGLLILMFSCKAFAQWPGYFYAFELKDSGGNIVDTNNINYRFTTIPCCSTIITGIKMCEGNKTWHFYAGGNKDLDKTNSLKIEKLEKGALLRL